MRAANKSLIVLLALALPACGADNSEQAMTNNMAGPADIEELPPDESVATPSDELANGAIDPEANDAASNQL